MTIRLLFIGDELLDGRILNKNQQTIGKALWESGFTVQETMSVGDPMDELVATMKDLNGKADVVICTGGIGPTEDDRTVEALSKMAGVGLERSNRLETMLRDHYQPQNRSMPESNLKQADLPHGATVLPNKTGTAVGIQLKVESTWWFLLPGVPREMKSMITDDVIPFLKHTFPDQQKQRQSITYQCVGLGESAIADRISSLYPLPEGAEIRFQVPYPEVHVQWCMDVVDDKSVTVFNKIKQQLDGLLHECCYTIDGRSFEEVVVTKLAEANTTLAIAESCTGGRVAQMVTSVPGSSSVLLWGTVTYSNASKQFSLDVPETVLQQHGAVSIEVAEAMAKGAREKSGADIGISTTGIAGPSGATSNKPVGMICIAVATEDGVRSEALHLTGKRDQIQIKASYVILDALRKLAF